MKIAGIEGPPPSGEVDQWHRLGSIAPQQQRLDTDGAPGGVLSLFVRLDNLESVARLPRDNLGLPFGKLGGQRFLPDRRQRLDSVLLGQGQSRRQKPLSAEPAAGPRAERQRRDEKRPSGQTPRQGVWQYGSIMPAARRLNAPSGFDLAVTLRGKGW